MKKTIFHILILVSIIIQSGNLKSQNLIEIAPLFEYPVAPEEIEALDEKCNYLVKNFWNNFDFKSKNPVDQHALNEAFAVYVTSMRYANKKEVDDSVNKLIGKISGSPILLYQFTKAAEENLYGPRADLWIDELYINFLEALLKNKKINEARKKRYLKQYHALQESKIGNTAPTFDFVDKDGNVKNYFPMSTPTLLIIGDPEDTDWRISRLKIDTNFKLGEAVDKGKVNVIYIENGTNDNWQESVSTYNSHWTVGQSKDIDGLYDVRINPSIYIIGPDGKIIKKFCSPEEAIGTILDIVNP